MSHNSKAVYQRYMGWYDANPSNLWPHPPSRSPPTSMRWAAPTRRWRARAGGRRRRLPLGRGAAQPRRVRRRRPTPRATRCRPTRSSRSATAPRTARGATPSSPAPMSCATGTFGTPTNAWRPTSRALTVEQVFGTIGIRIDGPRRGTSIWCCLGRHRRADHARGRAAKRCAQPTCRRAPHPGSTTFTLSRPTLIGLVTGTVDLTAAICDGTVGVQGDPADLARLVGLLTEPDPDFDIVTPSSPPELRPGGPGSVRPAPDEVVPGGGRRPATVTGHARRAPFPDRARRDAGRVGPPGRRPRPGRPGDRPRLPSCGVSARHVTSCGPGSARSPTRWASSTATAARTRPASCRRRAASSAPRRRSSTRRPSRSRPTCRTCCCNLPNIPSLDAPDGASEADNVITAGRAVRSRRLRRAPAGAALGDRGGARHPRPRTRRQALRARCS